jgi:hypothetical protein
MPDRRTHRGRHPADTKLFAPAYEAVLRTAVVELSWLLTRGYGETSALKLVGDHHGLTVRQRMAVRRSSCSDDSLRRRTAKCADMGAMRGRPLAIDGYNVLITIESALSGGLILIGRDGCPRDLASIHGTYRKVRETTAALELIIEATAALSAERVDFLLDQPVSNSGRLKALIAERLESREEKAGSTPQRWPVWNIELVPSPDSVLIDYDGVVATGDSVILNRCGSWCDLVGVLVRRIPTAWVLDLRSEGG